MRLVNLRFEGEEARACVPPSWSLRDWARRPEIPSSRVGRRRKRSLRDESARERSKDLEALGLMGGPTQTTHLQFQ